MSGSNQENDSDGGNGFNLGPDILEALLRASQNTADTDDLDSVEAISGEYSSINKTIDELNGFLDRWEERHTRLRHEIREVLSEQEQEHQENGSSSSGSDDHVTVDQSQSVVEEAVPSNEDNFQNIEMDTCKSNGQISHDVNNGNDRTAVVESEEKENSETESS